MEDEPPEEAPEQTSASPLGSSTELTPTEVTRCIEAWRRGDASALERLMPLIVDDLRRVAANRLAREGRPLTIQPTEMVNELYLRLADRRSVTFEGRGHFFASAATMLRRILVDHARSRSAARRGGGHRPVTIELDDLPAGDGRIDLVALDDALAALERADPRQAKVVELRFFGGLGIDEVAEHLDVSRTTVVRDFHYARLFLWDRLHG